MVQKYSWEERKELLEACKIRLKTGEISEDQFRRLLGGLNFNAYEIEEELKDAKQWMNHGKK